MYHSNSNFIHNWLNRITKMSIVESIYGHASGMRWEAMRLSLLPPGRPLRGSREHFKIT
jgi:hypothetical protein